MMTANRLAVTCLLQAETARLGQLFTMLADAGINIRQISFMVGPLSRPQLGYLQLILDTPPHTTHWQSELADLCELNSLNIAEAL